MYLKRIEIFGFKSFADKTEMEFGPGITTIVGPNGCGKSNVADAVRWVLGEQSARALRGGAMADVIFAGSVGKKAMGYAQVSLVLDNADGKLSVGYTEVMVSRRVDRSGEGEYFINQIPCRLKDVNDLFLDTGVGKDNYSIIGQGKIDEILSSKPEDRRALFEEAAGISRYKARKREAQRRLDETEQNLLRITDIIGELAVQMESLADQAERAAAHAQLDGELTRLDIGLIAHALAGVASRLEQQQIQNQQIQRRLTEIESQTEEAEQASAVSRNLAESLDQELTLLSTQVAESTGYLERAEGRQALAQQEQRGLETESHRLAAEWASLESKLQSTQDELVAFDQQAALLQEQIAAAGEAFTQAEREVAAAQGEAAVANRAVEKHKERIVSILQAEAEKKNSLTGAAQVAAETFQRMERLQGERARGQGEARLVADALKATAAELKRLDALRLETGTQLSQIQAEIRMAAGQSQDLQQKGSAVGEQIQGQTARLGAIEEMIGAFEGYQRGTRTVLQGREKGLEFAAEVLGAVAEAIRTEPQFEKAIEVALGGSIQNIITATDAGAKCAIEHLKRTGGGRATFLPLNVIRPQHFRGEDQREFEHAPGILGVAVDLVHFEERFRPAIASMLGRVLIATDMDAALAFGRKTGMRYRTVTLDGELLAAGGALTGGSVGNQGLGLLARERERAELTAKIAVLRTEHTRFRRELEQMQAVRTELDRKAVDAERALRAVETSMTRAEGEQTRLLGEERRWQELLDNCAAEAAQMEAAKERGLDLTANLSQELVALAKEREALEAEVGQMKQEGLNRLTELATQGRSLTMMQVKLAELSEQHRGVKGQVSRLEAERERLAADRLLKQEQQGEIRERMVRVVDELTSVATETVEAGQAKERFEADRARVQARKLEILAQVNQRDREMRGLRKAQQEAQGRLQQGEVEAARLKMEQETVTARLHEQHGMAPAAVSGSSLPDHEVLPARERTQALREQIRELGPVNPGAIADYQSAKEREQFMQQQRDDLEEAKSSLYRAVEELDKRIKVHFMDSFQVIRREFQRVYQELFEGGRADLHLLDETDLLETGIEIVAQPPGKKQQVLSLLSGGERAMTAIALLFALLRVKPTPFVFLDEVEAALDESNVERFGRYLRTLSSQGSQFICITHQRGTMEVADALYGVTMEGAGVSKVVSVRLVDIEQEAS